MFVERIWHDNAAVKGAPFIASGAAELFHLKIRTLSPKDDVQRAPKEEPLK
jgi:hypothetical protein